MQTPRPLRRKPRILLVEDNPADVRLVRVALTDIPIEPELSVATDGKAALLALHTARDDRPAFATIGIRHLCWLVVA